jgi:hypothetical protein
MFSGDAEEALCDNKRGVPGFGMPLLEPGLSWKFWGNTIVKPSPSSIMEVSAPADA